MVVELRDSVCVLFFSVHPFVLSFFLSLCGVGHVIRDIKDMTKILGERELRSFYAPQI